VAKQVYIENKRIRMLYKNGRIR